MGRSGHRHSPQAILIVIEAGLNGLGQVSHHGRVGADNPRGIYRSVVRPQAGSYEWTVPRLAHTEDDDGLVVDADQMLLF